LHKLSLLQTDHNGRFRLHQLLRDYAREKLATWPTAQAVYSRMVQYFIDHIALQGQITSGERPISPADVAYDIGHLHAALTIVQEQQLHDYLPLAVRAFFLPLHEQGVWVKLEEAIESTIALAEKTADFDLVAEMLTLRSKLLWWREEDGTATARQAVMLAQRAENPHLIADALRELGSWLNRASKFVEAEQVLLDALSIAEMVGDQAKIVAILNNLGLAHVYQQHWHKAQPFLERGYLLAQAIDYCRAAVILASNLGMLWAQQGAWQTAVSYFAAGAAIGREHDCLTALMGLLGEWGYEALFVSELETAHLCFTESLELARKYRHQVSVAMRLSELGEVARRQGNHATAVAHQAESLAIVQREKLTAWQAIVHLRLALVAADQNKLQMAKAEFAQGMKTVSLLHATYSREVQQITRQLQDFLV
ncbi:MAG: tetratricopeptide repeat protein, partial [Anaerolineales bacterium]|nr:tetratricopeptide repeat protein [Anaerolineales bacterium]